MRIAVLQMCAGIDPAANARTVEEAAAEAAAGGSAMLFTPEMTNIVDRDRGRADAALAAEGDDICVAAARRAATHNGLSIVLGSVALWADETRCSRVNRSLVIDAAGSVVARYDKIHLFDVDLATGESWRESKSYSPGARAVVADTPAGQAGLSVCYDLRFPALYQSLSAAGATLLSIPAAFTVPTGEAHWHVLLRARAIENASFVVAAAQSGDHDDGRQTFGHSLIVDPWGTVLLDMGTERGVAFCDIDPNATDEARARIPVIAHRRAFAAP